ncbi:MAG: hypothetical protein JNL54_09185 [Kineosporiaceae bacterium]|nr:hypothetical protein [Kineosporiaceae bacterium]
MELHERAQFDFLLNTAAERFVERLVQRTGDLEQALAALRADPQGEGVWLDEFVRAVLRDFLLDNTAGAMFVLGACESRQVEGAGPGTVTEVLRALSVRAFADVLCVKVDQGIELALSGHM